MRSLTKYYIYYSLKSGKTALFTMNTATLPSSAIPGLNDQFWKGLRKTLVPEFYTPDPDRIALAAALTKDSGIDLSKSPILCLGELSEITFDRVEAELRPWGHVHYSEPTRFGIMYMDALIKHGAAVKRDYMGPQAKHRFSKADRDYSNYDVEYDIGETTKLLEAKKREMFSLEIDFLKAVESEQYPVAEAYLRAILAKRCDAETLLRAEANNWLVMLAVRKKDLAMFVEAWNNRIVEGSVVKELFYQILQEILYGCLIRAFAVEPSAEGARKMARFGREQFANEQTVTYFRGVLEDLADELLKSGGLTVDGFKGLLKQTLESRRRMFLSVNPLMRDIQIVWK
jgi:hypothetical protein